MVKQLGRKGKEGSKNIPSYLSGVDSVKSVWQSISDVTGSQVINKISHL